MLMNIPISPNKQIDQLQCHDPIYRILIFGGGAGDIDEISIYKLTLIYVL